MRLIPGDELTPAQREAALAAYVHRHTIEHPYYAPGRAPASAVVTDAQWLEARSFWVNRNGYLSATRGCWVRAPAEPPTVSELADALRRIVEWIDAGCDPSQHSVDAARTLLARIDDGQET